jgi:hypothetical protein
VTQEFGAYAFVTKDWREKDYPVDLWLEWHSYLFDEICLVTYGDAELKSYKNTKIIEVPEKASFDFSFYREAEKIAQNGLNTKWKVLLDVDEFLPHRIDTSVLDPKKTYSIKLRNLYGNLETEIRGFFPEYFWVIHTGNKKILGDGGTVAGPYSAKILLFNAVKFGMWKYLKIGQHVSPLSPIISFEVFHTGTLRKPDAMSKKWKFQTEIEISEGYKENANRLALLNEPFNYHNFRKISEKNYLVKIDVKSVPSILTAHRERFWHVDFDPIEYSALENIPR